MGFWSWLFKRRQEPALKLSERRPADRGEKPIINSWLQMSRAAYLSRAARTRFALPCAGRVSRIASVVRTRRRPTAAA
jgi:hypothetical protein